MKTSIKTFLVLGLSLFMISCAHCKYGSSEQITSTLAAKSGSSVAGDIKLYQTKQGMIMAKLNISGLKPNSKHGFHIHENGDCSSADGKSAGGHFAPEGHSHAGPEAEKRHLGDLGNVSADENGQVKAEIEIPRASLKEADKFSILNRAFVLHAGSDDLKSQPSGAAGKRIACAVIK